MILEVSLFIVIGILALFLFFSWAIFGEDLRVPLIFLCFQFCKILSDTSLFVEQPPKTLWVDFNLLGYTFKLQDWFLANVDGYAGMLLIGLYFFITSNNFCFKHIIVVFYSVALVYLLVVEFTLQLMNSYAVFSAFVCFFASIWMTNKFMKRDVSV